MYQINYWVGSEPNATNCKFDTLEEMQEARKEIEATEGVWMTYCFKDNGDGTHDNLT